MLAEQQNNRIAILKDRALMLKRVRDFFYERNVAEVDCPILSMRASVDAHIDLIPATVFQQTTAYLHSSPEYGMKRLLSEGIGDIFQLSHVFRDSEAGSRHNIEFMMIEWYRLGFSFEALIDETCLLISQFFKTNTYRVYDYAEIFQQYTGIDPLLADWQTLETYIQEQEIYSPFVFGKDSCDDLLQLILAEKVEPHLGKEELAVLAFFPPTQAALAKIRNEAGRKKAERFEVYYKGIELANGYHELQDAHEQKKRLEEANRQRTIMGKNPLPIDTNFLASLEKGMPDCCGVAVGFDRLMMIRHNVQSISNVIPWAFQGA